jgi:hypothetical protein
MVDVNLLNEMFDDRFAKKKKAKIQKIDFKNLFLTHFVVVFPLLLDDISFAAHKTHNHFPLCCLAFFKQSS